MKNEEIRNEIIRVLNTPAEELCITHPTVFDHKANFVEYTKDGYFTLKYPIQPLQCNGFGTLQGGTIAAFIDDNFGLFSFVALEGKTVSTINMIVNYHKAAFLTDGYLTVTSHVVSAGKRVISMASQAYNPNGDLIASCSTNCANVQNGYLEY